MRRSEERRPERTSFEKPAGFRGPEHEEMRSVFEAGVRAPLGTTFLLNEVRVPQVRGARNDFPEGEGVREGRRSSRNDCRRVRLPERCDGQCPELEKPLGFDQEHEKTRSVFGAGVRAPKVRVAGQEFEKTEGLRGTNVVSVSTEGTKKRRSSTGRCGGAGIGPFSRKGLTGSPRESEKGIWSSGRTGCR